MRSSLKNKITTALFEQDVVLCSVSVIPLQHRNCSVCMSFVKDNTDKNVVKFTEK